MEDYGLSEEDFKGTSAQFDVEYLERITSEKSDPSELSRQSLYVKFDPLVGTTSVSQSEPRMDGTIVDALLAANETIPTTANTGGENTGESMSLPNLTEPNSTQLAVASSKELRYSEDDVVKALKNLIETEAENVAKKYSEELTALQRELKDTQEMVAHLKSGKGLKAIIKQAHKQDMAQLEHEHQQWEALSAEHEKVETLIVNRHEERKGNILSDQHETVSAEKSLSSLEHSLEDLLQRYASLRDQSTNLENHQNILKQDIESLQAESQRISGEYTKLEQEQISLIDKGNKSYESLQKELTSRLAVERVTTKKLELQAITLNTEQQNKVRDKEQLTKLCDELLQELNQAP